MNIYIIGNLNDTLTGDALNQALDRYREAENQLAAFGHGVLSPHHLPADLRGGKGLAIRVSMMQAADAFFVNNGDGESTFILEDFKFALSIGKSLYFPPSLYDRWGSLRSMMGVEKIEENADPSIAVEI